MTNRELRTQPQLLNIPIKGQKLYLSRGIKHFGTCCYWKSINFRVVTAPPLHTRSHHTTVADYFPITTCPWGFYSLFVYDIYSFGVNMPVLLPFSQTSNGFSPGNWIFQFINEDGLITSRSFTLKLRVLTVPLTFGLLLCVSDLHNFSIFLLLLFTSFVVLAPIHTLARSQIKHNIIHKHESQLSPSFSLTHTHTKPLSAVICSVHLPEWITERSNAGWTNRASGINGNASISSSSICRENTISPALHKHA